LLLVIWWWQRLRLLPRLLFVVQWWVWQWKWILPGLLLFLRLPQLRRLRLLQLRVPGLLGL
ncbi:M96 mating-specific protein, putative, partial [Phytophthora infestans T30-4]